MWSIKLALTDNSIVVTREKGLWRVVKGKGDQNMATENDLTWG